MLVFAVVFGNAIAKQSEVEKIGRAWLKFERREIALIQRRSVGPDPADAIFFQQMNKLRTVPPRMPKFDGKTKSPRQLLDERSQRNLALFWNKGWWQLHQNNVQLGRKCFDRMQKSIQLC